MGLGGVLVFGSSDSLANTGLKADEKALEALKVPAASVSTGSTSRNAGGHEEQVVETVPTVLRTQISNALRNIDCKVVKIGALFSEDAVKAVSEILQQKGTEIMSVIDVEPFFKTGSAPPKFEVVTTLRKDLLPFITLLSATVPEVMHLLHDAGVPTDYPRGIPDVQALAMTLARELGPQYVMIKREFVDEEDGATTLHYVLAGGGGGAEPPVMATSRFDNPQRVFGASYCVPPAISAYLAQGYSVPEAVSAGFAFVGELLKGGEFFSATEHEQ